MALSIPDGNDYFCNAKKTVSARFYSRLFIV